MTENQEPLFTAIVNPRGQITIRKDVRLRKNLNPGDLVDVYDIRLRLPPSLNPDEIKHLKESMQHNDNLMKRLVEK
jgi:bifunctional DNA-binding transcriptional regulator/antitoxin component of YhaV-PrlF toxin-antitoxin module